MLREAGRLQPQGSMLRGWEEQRLLLGGGTLFLSSTAANALGAEIIPPGDRNHWSGFLEIWHSHGCATLVCLFCRPWLSVATDK